MHKCVVYNIIWQSLKYSFTAVNLIRTTTVTCSCHYHYCASYYSQCLLSLQGGINSIYYTYAGVWSELGGGWHPQFFWRASAMKMFREHFDEWTRIYSCLDITSYAYNIQAIQLSVAPQVMHLIYRTHARYFESIRESVCENKVDEEQEVPKAKGIPEKKKQFPDKSW